MGRVGDARMVDVERQQMDLSEKKRAGGWAVSEGAVLK